MKWRRKGYLTVEASFILSMAVIVTGIMLSLCFHVYQRCWYTQAACETVLSGSFQGTLKGRAALEKAEEKWDKLTEMSSSVTGNDREIRCRVERTTPVWGKMPLRMEVSASQKVVRPVTFIRKIEALTE